MAVKSRRKGARVELEAVHALQQSGFAAEKISRMYKEGHDINVPLLGRDLRAEVKARAKGFQTLYAWLDKGPDILIVKQDRRERLVVVPWSLAVQIATAAERNK